MSGATTSFPTAYAAIPTDRLLEVFAAGPARIRQALRGLSEEELRARPVPGKWSALEIAMHLTDSELIGAARIRLVLGADDPRLPAYDQDRWARDHGYQDAGAARLEATLDLFAALRATTLPLLERADTEQWRRTGVHHEHGSVTLRNLLELYADHSEKHLGHILERRARLASPIELPSLLAHRLY